MHGRSFAVQSAKRVVKTSWCARTGTKVIDDRRGDQHRMMPHFRKTTAAKPTQHGDGDKPTNASQLEKSRA